MENIIVYLIVVFLATIALVSIIYFVYTLPDSVLDDVLNEGVEEEEEEGLEEENNEFIGQENNSDFSGMRRRISRLEKKETLRRRREYELQRNRDFYNKQRDEIEREREKERKIELELENEERERNRLREERMKQEEEDYKKWRQNITITSSGDIDDEKLKILSKTKELVSIIQTEQIVILDKLRKKFDVSMDTLVWHLNDLVENKQIEGIFDEQGRFIFWSQDQIESITNIIKQKGRISIEDLTEKINRFFERKQK